MSNNCTFSSEWLKNTCTSLKANDVHLTEVTVDPGSHAFSDKDMMALSDALRKNKVVTSIVFRNVDMGKGGIRYFAPTLKNSKSIFAVKLDDVRGEGQIAVALALSLNATGSIRVLHIKASIVDIRSAESLGLMLSVNRSIAELRLCHNKIDRECAEALAQGLKTNCAVRVLDLLGNAMDDDTVTKVVQCLAYNKSVEFLCLDFNEFGNRGVKAIAKMLCKNNVLGELHLFGNRIDSRGAKHLAAGLELNSALKTLILSFNQIGDDGAAAVAKALTINTTLTKVWFPSNSIGNHGMQAIAEYLPQMKGLEQLNVGDFFDNCAAEALLEGLKLNMSLSVLHMESPVYDDEWMDDKVDFYLRLNKSGRSLLQQAQAPIALWATALSKASVYEKSNGTPDVLHYLLREKPDLFDFRR